MNKATHDALLAKLTTLMRFTNAWMIAMVIVSLALLLVLKTE